MGRDAAERQKRGCGAAIRQTLPSTSVTLARSLCGSRTRATGLELGELTSG
jgi:hypothetical protein